MKNSIFIRKKILITGATGFIGANLLRYFLKEGADLNIFTRKDSDKWRIKDILPRVREFKVDLRDKGRLERAVTRIRPEIILHTAVYGNFPYHSDSRCIVDVNLEGTMNLIDCCKGIDFELFVNSGSSSEYGLKPKPIKEEDPLEPLSTYGASKAAAGFYAQKIAREYNKPIVTLRLFSPYGYFEGADRLIPSAILSCLKGRKLELSSPNNVRDFVFIEDVVNAYAKAFKNRQKLCGEIFNIGSGSQHTIRFMVTKIIGLTGAKIKPVWNSLDNPRVEPKHWQANIDKAKRELRWEPLSDPDKGLSKTIEWFRHHINLYS